MESIEKKDRLTEEDWKAFCRLNGFIDENDKATKKGNQFFKTAITLMFGVPIGVFLICCLVGWIICH